MRLTSLACKVVALLAVYAFACGALVNQGTSDAYWHHFFARLLEPLNGLNPIAGAILIGGIFLFAASLAFGPGGRTIGEANGWSFWSSLVLAAFVVSAIAVCAAVAFIFAGSRFGVQPAEVGSLFAAGVFEAVLGVLLAVLLLFLRRPRIIFLPALGLLLVGISALGAMFWLGTGTLA